MVLLDVRCQRLGQILAWDEKASVSWLTEINDITSGMHGAKRHKHQTVLEWVKKTAWEKQYEIHSLIMNARICQKNARRPINYLYTGNCHDSIRIVICSCLKLSTELNKGTCILASVACSNLEIHYSVKG